MSFRVNAQKVMLEHSRAKVELYASYLPIYLSILGQVPSINKIYLFDLLCGEGVYSDDSKGSPIVALEAIKNYYFSHGGSCPNIEIWFNDKGRSKVERGKSKIDRVRERCSHLFKPNNVTIDYRRDDFQLVLNDALQKINADTGVKGLFFIDPYGYKMVRPEDIRSIMANGNTEVILFLPVSFMYRFAERTLQNSFPGSAALQNFLGTLFQQSIPSFKSTLDFVYQLKEQFKLYLQPLTVYVDTFTLERDHANTYCLFFFTSSVRGFEKMLEAKWKIDIDQGKGFTLDQSLPLWDELHTSDFPDKVLEFIRSAPYRTNEELYLFGLNNGFLPKHVNRILTEQKKDKIIEAISLDNEPARGNYIEYKSERRIGFRSTGNMRLF